MAAQCRSGNRKRHTVSATEPNRAAVETALACTCATETRAASEIPSIRGAPSGRPERPQSGGGDRCVVTGVLRSPLFHFSAASTDRCTPYRYPEVTDASRGRRFLPDADCEQYTLDGRAPPVPSTSGETCSPYSRRRQPAA